MASSTPINTIQGLTSGIKWQDMIDSIVQADSTPITNLNNRIAAAQTREAAWLGYKAAIQSLSDAASGLADGSRLGALTTSISGLTAGAGVPFSASATTGATAGDYAIAVTRLAAAEKLGGASFASSSSALGVAGEFRINGQVVQIGASDTLASIAQRINAANSGASPLGVSATVAATTSGGYRLVLTSSRTGAAGISLTDGATGVLHDLGLLDDSSTIANPLSNGFRSASFADSTTAVGSLLKLTSPPLTVTVTIGGVPVDIDLSRESLQDIADNFNAAAGSSLMSVTTDAAGTRSLLYTGPTDASRFVDDSHVLELLGITRAGRGNMAQKVQSSALTVAGGGQATASTLLTDLGAVAGETLSFSGTRDDGTAITVGNFTIAADSTLDDLLAALNAPTTGFGAGVASMENGRLTITDATAGDSLLSLQVAAHNENGGTLDFGTLTTTQVGQTRQITAGADALIQVDGTPVQRSSNTITDAIAGVTLSLTGTSTAAADLTIARDTSASITAIKAFVSAYNKVADFVTQQSTPPATGQTAPPLFSDSLMRSIRTTLMSSVQKLLSAGVAGSWTRLGDIGVTVDKSGHFQVDDATLRAAVAADPEAIQRLFGLSGSSSTASLSYLGATDATPDGTYTVAVTTAPEVARASGAARVTGTGTMTVKDLGSGKSYTVSLTDGQDAASVAAALNAEFVRATSRTLTASGALTDAGQGGAPVTDSTTWADAQDGFGAIAQAGDQLTISGRTALGASFTFSYDVSASSTLGDLRSQIQSRFGSDATVSWSDAGALTVTASTSGSSLLSLAITSNGANPAPFGSLNVAEEGRFATGIRADGSSGALTLTGQDYGSLSGFSVTYAGTDAGIAGSTEFRGVDVVGTLNGAAATGSGQVLTAAAGSAAEGLRVRYTGTGAGTGSLTFSRGIASTVLLSAATFLGSGDGSIDALTQGIDTSIAGYNDQITAAQARLDKLRERLTAQFTAMEEAIAKAQTQMQWLTSQISQLSGYSSSNNSSGS